MQRIRHSRFFSSKCAAMPNELTSGSPNNNSLGKETNMLIITRKHNQSFYIGDDIKITILPNDARRGGGQIRIGILAPKHIAVNREEVYKRIQQEKLAS